jgi:hypothetical protein
MRSEVFFFDNLLSKALKKEKAAFRTLYKEMDIIQCRGWGFDLGVM